ncbi:MAG: threonine synthase [Cyclobacteriaceae bacterium]|nr:threonine synthase [Cyclobacteriaceae bacterium]
MKFYSTNNKDHKVSLREAVMQGLAPDNGLYMPESIPVLPTTFFESIRQKTFPEIAFEVAHHLLGEDIPELELKRIVSHTIKFEAPLVEIENDLYALELFHGPTMAFKDFGARFMSQLLGYFAKQQDRDIVILVATSGDTGSAVANGFLGVAGTQVVVLYPSGKVSEVQEKQFTTLNQNITALEIDGTFDDCQRLVKQAFLDDELRNSLFLTSANSINIARLIPQSFYYFWAYAQLKNRRPLVFSIPSGNFGNLTGGLFAKRMGLPVEKFIAATNLNDIVPAYLRSRIFAPRPSITTISNAMDVGNPSNFSRMLDLFANDIEALQNELVGYSFSDDETREAMKEVSLSTGYVMDPHGAVGYLGLKQYLQKQRRDVVGVFLETAHPGKFINVVEETLEKKILLPAPLQKFMAGKKLSIPMSADFSNFKSYLLQSLKGN